LWQHGLCYPARQPWARKSAAFSHAVVYAHGRTHRHDTSNHCVPLTWRAVAAIAAGSRVSLSTAARARIEHAKALVGVIVKRRLRCYGVKTGVGALSEVIVDESQQSILSRRIIMSHACGVPWAPMRCIARCAAASRHMPMIDRLRRTSRQPSSSCDIQPRPEVTLDRHGLQIR
jgi:hypothetical protein